MFFTHLIKYEFEISSFMYGFDNFICPGTESKGYSSSHRRGKSETLRVHYINRKDIRFGYKLMLLDFCFCWEQKPASNDIMVPTELLYGTWWFSIG